jgi:hypothetical protein
MLETYADHFFLRCGSCRALPDKCPPYDRSTLFPLPRTLAGASVLIETTSGLVVLRVFEHPNHGHVFL